MSDKELFYKNLALFGKPGEAEVFFKLVGEVVEKYSLSFLDERLNLSVAESGRFRLTLMINDKKVLEVKRSRLGLELFFLLSTKNLSFYQSKDYDYLSHEFFKSKRFQDWVLVGFDLSTLKLAKYKNVINDWHECINSLYSRRRQASKEGHSLYFYIVVKDLKELDLILKREELGNKFIGFEQEVEVEEAEVKFKFDPQRVDIGAEQKSLDILINRIKYDEINLLPDFQRNMDLWSVQKMSLLIESILLNLPLPAFYFDGSNPDRWIVVDGLQRLSTLQKFVVYADKNHEKYQKRLKLKGLETLSEFNDKDYNELPSRMKRRISEFTATLYLIKPGSDKNIKYSIFQRINTGGITLNPQEIRNALNQHSDAPQLLEELSRQNVFKRIVNVSAKRMQDKELVLRFIAYQILERKEYEGSMSRFLDLAMDRLGEEELQSQYADLEKRFIKALVLAEKIFGEHVFSKSIRGGNNSFNRTLYDVWMYYFSFLDKSQEDKLLSQKPAFVEDFKNLLIEAKFDDSITFASATTGNLEYRFAETFRLIKKYVSNFTNAWIKEDNDQETTHQEL